MTPAAAIDFKLTTELATHMGLRTIDMVRLFSVSRVTYNRWVRGLSAPDAQRIDSVRKITNNLMLLVITNRWPLQDVVGMKHADRYMLLLELLKEYD